MMQLGRELRVVIHSCMPQAGTALYEETGRMMLMVMVRGTKVELASRSARQLVRVGSHRRRATILNYTLLYNIRIQSRDRRLRSICSLEDLHTRQLHIHM